MKRPPQNGLGLNGISKLFFNVEGVFLSFFFRLKRSYREHAGFLYQTGEGLRNDGDFNEDSHHEYADCYVPAAGPDGSTTQTTKNIWGA
jgi:hypothetical protein